MKKTQTVLTDAGVTDLEITLRDVSATAYPIKGHDRVFYVQLNFTSTPLAVSQLHAMFNTPVVGAEPVLLRFMTLKQK